MTIDGYRRVAVIAAMKKEVELLIGKKSPSSIEAEVEFYDIAGGYEKPSGFVICICGVGKVNAAMATQLLVERYTPDVILNVGVAGSVHPMKLGTIVVARGFVQHDVDTSAVGDEPGFVSTVNKKFFEAVSPGRYENALFKNGFGYHAGTIATGDWFAEKGVRCSSAISRFRPAAFDMEGGAIAQVCHRNGIPFAAIKSVSDCVTEPNGHEAYESSMSKACYKLSLATLVVVKEMKEDVITQELGAEDNKGP